MGRFAGSRRCLFPSLTPVAKLILDFYNKKYSLNGVNYDSVMAMPGAMFSNASGGYADNADGTVSYFPPNTPRIGKNGYISELQGSNLCLSSQALQNGSIWTYFYLGSATDNSVLAPDGTMTGSSFVATNPNSDFHSYAIPVSANQTYTLSFYVKLGAGASAAKQIKIANSGGSVIGSAVPITGANSSSWTRVSCTVNVGANTSILLYPLTGAATAGTYYVWGVQLEQSSVPTSYIPTKYAAVTNICQQSNYLATSPWSVVGSVVATNNNAIAPDGSQTATLLTTNFFNHGIRQNITVTANTTYTWSFYAKLGTMTAASYSVYNLSGATELVVATSYTSKVSKNGWSRISVTFTTPTGCTSVGCYPIRDSGVTGTIYIWGCQLELGATASAYVPVSPAVTNYALQSKTIASWSASSTTNTNNTTIAPDGTATAGTVATATTGFANAWLTTPYTTTAGTVFTISVYMKPNASNFGYLNVATDSNYATIIANFSTGIVTQATGGGAFSIVTASITPEANGFFRVALAILPSSNVVCTMRIGPSATATASLSTSGIPSSTAGNSIYVWSMQLEIGHGANQVVATTTVSASLAAQTSATLPIQSSFKRSPDLLSFSSQLGLSFNNIKAMVTEGSYLVQLSTNHVMGYLSDGTNNNYISIGSYLGNFLSQLKIAGGLIRSLYQAANIALPATIRKQGVSFGDGKYVVSQNGSAVNDTGNTNPVFTQTPAFNQLAIGVFPNLGTPQMHGYVKEVRLYSTALNQSQLNALTK